jgi:hypothetical protein
MLKLRIGILNPFKFEEFRHIWRCNWAVTKNKTLELEFYRYAYEVVSVDLDLSWRGRDHAGPDFELNILGWSFRIALPDNRHWDWEKDTWEKY